MYVHECTVVSMCYYYLPDIAASAFDGTSTDNAVTCFCDQTLHYNNTYNNNNVDVYSCLLALTQEREKTRER